MKRVRITATVTGFIDVDDSVMIEEGDEFRNEESLENLHDVDTSAFVVSDGLTDITVTHVRPRE